MAERRSAISYWPPSLIAEYQALKEQRPPGTHVPRAVTKAFREKHNLSEVDWVGFQYAVFNAQKPIQGRVDFIRRREQSVLMLALLGKTFEEMVAELQDDQDFEDVTSHASLRAVVFAIVDRLGVSEKERIALGMLSPPSQKLLPRRQQVLVGRTLGLSERMIGEFLGVSSTTVNNDMKWLKKRPDGV